MERISLLSCPWKYNDIWRILSMNVLRIFSIFEYYPARWDTIVFFLVYFLIIYSPNILISRRCHWIFISYFTYYNNWNFINYLIKNDKIVRISTWFQNKQPMYYLLQITGQVRYFNKRNSLDNLLRKGCLS